MPHRFSEELIRHQALTEEGKPCEILERVTYERQTDADEKVVVNRRYDLRTGEPVNRLSETEFVNDVSGTKLRLRS